MHAAEDQPPRHRHRAALAHREGEAAERRARHLHGDRQPADAREQPLGDVDRERRRDERAEQNERQRLDDDRDEDEDEGLDLGDLAGACGPGGDDRAGDERENAREEDGLAPPAPAARLDADPVLDRADGDS